MVEFASNSTTVSTPDALHPSKLKKSEPLDPFDLKANDYSFADSFLDYDSLNDWIEELTSPVMVDAKTVLPKAEVHLNQANASVSNPTVEGPAQPVVAVSVPVVQASIEASDKSRDLNGIIEEGMSKVSLVTGSGSTGNIDLECRKDESESDVESEGTSSATTSSSSSHGRGRNDEKDEEEENSSSSSSDDSSCDDEEEENKFTMKAEGHGEIGELEEGEIRDVEDEDEEASTDQMVAWDGDGGDPDIDDDEEVGVEGGPISSKNELKVLPPVPQVYATLQPQHQIIPVGVVLSIIGNQVIVEGVEKHNPLNEGSILWITETRSPLGLIDEIFGPVKYPYYSVRYNSESEVPTGICGGTRVSFVLEFADYILNNKDLYKKGYDASGVNDEEVSDDDEFSDDEKELEFKKMQRLAKRSTNNNQKNGNGNNTRKKKNSGQARKFGQRTYQNAKIPNESRNYGEPTPQQAMMTEGSKFVQHTPQQAKMDMVQPSSNQNQHNGPPYAPFVYHGGCPNPSAAEQCFINGSGVIPSFPPTYSPCFTPAMNGIRPTEMPFHLQQQQNPFFPNALPMNGMPWLLQNPAQQVPQMPMMNTFGGAAYPQGLIGTSPSLPNPLTSVGTQGIHSGGLQFGQNQNLQPPPPLAIPGSMEATQLFNPANSHPLGAFPGNVAPPQFNPDSSSSQGRKSHGRGGGSHFRGRRGRRQTR
ncbi:H/ACA ribonucleoprotein complex non-core subunit NAF1-like [Momordica charantia]|uniref:H/ACA ribonucleoprotein complex non-core subunit NAF1 n=1 Tax=Momordica charantia TaxID=3673 RepID=A0A6J1D5T5_MOMCH|nr:H/ACA ribonucleoprotein complex non-core subunit NAF1-like [Momordica charantia]XP_022149470.1 H/ACA ribonucleoprotein complex non-core subunit NAF1-like [Momordica charantia]